MLGLSRTGREPRGPHANELAVVKGESTAPVKVISYRLSWLVLSARQLWLGFGTLNKQSGGDFRRLSPAKVAG